MNGVGIAPPGFAISAITGGQRPRPVGAGMHVQGDAMTISRERTTVTTAMPGQAQFAKPSTDQGGTAPWLMVGEVARSGSGAAPDRLYIIAEAVSPNLRAGSVGAGVIAAIRDIYGSSEHEDPVAALAAALDAANLALYQQNLTTTPGRRVVLGLTCLVAREQELLICQVPPTQLILSQGGTPIALPELATWHRDYQPHARDDRQGLGATETATPLLFRATLEDGDLITLCTSNLARVLAATGDDSDLGPLLGSDPAAAIEFLAELAEQQHLELAYATAITPTLPYAVPYQDRSEPEYDETLEDDFDQSADQPSHHAGGNWFERGLREMRERSRIISWPRRSERPPARRGHLHAIPDDTPEDTDGATLREALEDGHEDERVISAFSMRTPQPRHSEQAEIDPDDGWDDEPAVADTRANSQWRAEAARADQAPAWDREDRAYAAPDDYAPSPRAPRRNRRTGPLQWLGSLTTLLLLVVGTVVERFLPAGGRRRNEGYLDRSRNRVWPIGGLERYESRGLPLGRALPALILGAIVVIAVVLLLSIRNHQIRTEQARFDTALAKVTQAREAAQSSPDRQAAHNQLLALPAQLAAIPAADKPGRPERIVEEQGAIAVALDKVDGIQRIAAPSIQLVAPLPANAGSASTRPQIVIGDGKQFVLYNGTVYWLDGRKTLTKILAKGDTVGGIGVNTILGIAWRVDSLFAYSETQGFVRDAAGAWTALPLAASGRKSTAVDSYLGNLYLLEGERGQIVKFASGAYNQVPQPWSSTKANGDLNLAVDFTIDTDIYVLLADGRVLDFYQGEIKATYKPSLVPPLAGASAMTTAPDSRWLYIVDPREGRILRFSRDGAQLDVFKPAEGAKSFTGVREVAVDEPANMLYLLTDEGLLSVRLP